MPFHKRCDKCGEQYYYWGQEHACDPDHLNAQCPFCKSRNTKAQTSPVFGGMGTPYLYICLNCNKGIMSTDLQ